VLELSIRSFDAACATDSSSASLNLSRRMCWATAAGVRSTTSAAIRGGQQRRRTEFAGRLAEERSARSGGSFAPFGPVTGSEDCGLLPAAQARLLPARGQRRRSARCCTARSTTSTTPT